MRLKTNVVREIRFLFNSKLIILIIITFMFFVKVYNIDIMDHSIGTKTLICVYSLNYRAFE